MPTTTHLSRILGLTISFALVLGACSVAGSSTATPADEPAAAASDPAAGEVPAQSSNDAWLVVGRRGGAGLEVILASTREQIYELPVGVPDGTWRELVTTTPSGSATAVETITVQPDLPARTRSLDGGWRLPTLGADALPVGVSPDGSTIVLVEDDAGADAGMTRFAVLSQGEATRIVALAGSFEYDTLSPDGSILYVVERLPGPPDGHYQVRAVDVATGLMRDAIIVDKRNIDESMGGWPITQARHANGVVFTLYRGTGNPFIHALNSLEAWAVCIDLPAIGSDDADAALDWGLTQRADGRAVYAVNATLGLAVEVNPEELNIRQATTFPAPVAAARFSLAKFGHQEPGPVGRRVIASVDGSVVFAAGATGIVELESGRLTATRTILEGVPVDGLGLTPDGATLYALLADGGRIVKLDVASGELVGEVPGGGFDRLVAIVPW